MTEITSSDYHNIRLVGFTDMNGRGNVMHVNVHAGYAYTGHTGSSPVATSVIDVHDPTRPKVVNEILAPDGIQATKVQIVDGVMMTNNFKKFLVLPPGQKGDFQSGGLEMSWERDPRGVGGVRMYDLADPVNPKELSFFPFYDVGPHRPTWWTNPYAYVSGRAEGFDDDILHTLDCSDPTNVKEVGRWWFPGQHTSAGEEPEWRKEGRRFALHHAIPRGDYLYGGYWDAGLIIWNNSDPTNPKMVGHLPLDPEESGATHSPVPLPGRDVLALVDEQTKEGIGTPERFIRLIDISDPTNPSVLSRLPSPQGDYRQRPGRSGPHNVHEGRPGSLQDGNTLYATYFNAGLRVFDTTDPTNPHQIAHFVADPPAGQKMVLFDDVIVMPEGLIYVTDRLGGLYIFELTGRD